MSKRVSIINNMLDPNFLERILNTKLSNEKILKLNEKEHREEVGELNDLKDLKSKSEAEIYKALNSMVLNKQYFMYCGPILLNINPGPHNRESYLNLENWIRENEGINLEDKKPHLYSYIESIFEALVKEKKDQTVNLLGHIGSGKTFNLVHTLEYLCFFHAPEKKQIEFFDIIHKSMQIVHILGSIFRRNNIESSSCGMQIRIGFDDNQKICNFDLKANILDLTLPFSENGRSFSILHSIITSASTDLKNFLELPERELSLNFFKKFSHHFNKETKDRFMLNDYEIWNRFHSLLNTFGFSKGEIIEILQLFSFILLCNEASIGKKRSAKHGEMYSINKNPFSRKLAKNFGMNEDDFIKFFGVHKDLEATKNHLICLMKYTYNCIFEFIMERVNLFLKDYFAPYLPKKPNKMHQFNDSFNVNAQKINIKETDENEDNLIKYINFIDIPGEVNDHTLGGLLTNLANECQNLFAGGNFMSIIEKLQTEHIEMKYFQPIHSYYVLQSLLSKEGLLGYLSRKFTEKNFKSFCSRSRRRDFYKRCLKFVEEADDELTFDFKYSNKNVTYNYLSLYKEAKNCIVSPELLKLFSQSKNSIIKSQIPYITSQPKNIHGLCVKILFNLFENLKGASPYVIYCLHSNTSLKVFFDKHQQIKEDKIIKGEIWEIPKRESIELLYHSIALPILYWSWFGFNEWIDVEMFVSEFSDDFKKIQNYVNRANKEKRIPGYANSAKIHEGKQDINLKKINPFEASEVMLKIFCKPQLYLMGSQHILFKKGTINNIRETIKNVLEAQEKAMENKRMNGSMMNMSKIPTGRRISAKTTMMANRSMNPSRADNNNNNVSFNKSFNKSVNKGKDTSINKGRLNSSNVNNTNNNNNNSNSKAKGTKTKFSNSIGKSVKGTFSNNPIPKGKNNISVVNKNNKNANQNRGGGSSQMSANSSMNKGNNSIHNKSKLDKNSSINAIINTEENYNMNMQEINEYSGGFSENQKINLDQNDTFKDTKNIDDLNLDNNLEEENNNQEEEKYICKRSMKNECQIEIIQKVLDVDDNKANQEAKDDLGLNLGGLDDDNDKKKENPFNAEADYDILVGGKYSLFHIIDPQKYQHHEFVGSVDITQATHLESEFDIYKNKNNVVVPKNKYFHSIKNLFDYSKIDNFGIFDYSNMLPEIVFIQKSWRKHRVVKKFMVWRYAIRCFLLIQRWLRGFIVRVKFREFKVALKFVKKLQLFYRRRFEAKTKAAIKIQSIIRMKMGRIYYLNKLARREMHDESDEDEHISTEYEEVEPDIVYEEIEVEVTVESDEEENETAKELGIEDGIEIVDEKGDLIGVSDRKSVVELISQTQSQRNSIYQRKSSVQGIKDIIEEQKTGGGNLNVNANGKPISKKNSIYTTETTVITTSYNNRSKNVSRKNSIVNIVTPGRKSITCIEDLDNLMATGMVKKPKKKKTNKISQKKNQHIPDGKNKKNLDDNVFKKKKIVKKIVRRVIYPDDVNLFEKGGQKGVLERAKKYRKVTRIESGYSRMLKKKRKQQGDFTEKELGNISQSKIDKKSMINDSSVIGKKIFQNNMKRISLLEPDKDKLLICDLLMKTEAVKGGDNTVNYLNDNFGIIKKNIRDSTKKLNTVQRPKQKIEDRLLSYGEHVKIKKVEKKMEQMKTEASNYPFKPTTTLNNNSRMDSSLFNRSNIMDRSILYHQEKEEKREMLKNKHQKKEEDFIFKPRINSQSKSIKRNLNDLYEWKNRVEDVKREKMRFNEMDLELNREREYTPNANSMMIVKKNNYSNFKKNANRSQDDIKMTENQNNEEIEFDLWPDINKTYIKGGQKTENSFIGNNSHFITGNDFSNFEK